MCIIGIFIVCANSCVRGGTCMDHAHLPVRCIISYDIQHHQASAEHCHYLVWWGLESWATVMM